MMELSIPGRDTLLIEHIVFDYNGTVAVDGILPESIKNLLTALSENLNVYILTADTYGNVLKQCQGLPITVKTFINGSVTLNKREFIKSLGSEKTIAIGNGMNDAEMLKESILSIVVMGEEGCAAKALCNADIVVKDIKDVFAMILNKNRIIATLRD